MIYGGIDTSMDSIIILNLDDIVLFDTFIFSNSDRSLVVLP